MDDGKQVNTNEEAPKDTRTPALKRALIVTVDDLEQFENRINKRLDKLMFRMGDLLNVQTQVRNLVQSYLAMPDEDDV